jgi:hypothetical protein
MFRNVKSYLIMIQLCTVFIVSTRNVVARTENLTVSYVLKFCEKFGGGSDEVLAAADASGWNDPAEHSKLPPRNHFRQKIIKSHRLTLEVKEKTFALGQGTLREKICSVVDDDSLSSRHIIGTLSIILGEKPVDLRNIDCGYRTSPAMPVMVWAYRRRGPKREFIEADNLCEIVYVRPGAALESILSTSTVEILMIDRSDGVRSLSYFNERLDSK